MPDFGYEIVDFQYNTWQITSWTSLEKRITGPEFEAGGVPAGWHCCAQFALALWNPEDPTSYVFHCTYVLNCLSFV
ncbi:10191_t:CDS:2, partial [Racocetra fulgida]